MKAPSPAFSVYPKDVDSDETCKLMDLEQFGAYWRLLLHAWIEGSIPADRTVLTRLLGVNPRAFARIWPGVAPCWRQSPDDPKRLVQLRQEQQRLQQLAFSHVQSMKRTRHAKSNEINKTAEPVINRCSTKTEPVIDLPFPSPFPSPRITDPPFPPADAVGPLVPQGDPEPDTAPPDAPPDHGHDRTTAPQQPGPGPATDPATRNAKIRFAEAEAALVDHAIALHGRCWRDERRRIREWLRAGMDPEQARDAIASGEHRPRGRL